MNYSLLPLDNFVVINKSILTDEDRMNLILLYQPIVGSLSISLYFTLWGYLDKNKINSKGNSHNDIVNNMQVKLEDIKESREKLEAMGLIRTYLKKGDINNYIYELYSPLSAHEFLSNPILNTALYNNLSKNEYKRIIENYSLPKIDFKDYKDISCSFKDVYNFIPSLNQENKNIKKVSHLDLSFEPNIDFNEVLALIPEEMLNVKSITMDIKELIYKLSFIYNFDNEIMSGIIKNSTEDRKINIDLLKENCRNYYKFESKGKIPKLVYKSQPLYLRQDKIENTNRDIMINQFETFSPYEYLSLKQNNSKPSDSDLDLIGKLLIDEELSPGVVNVLIDYVLRIKNNKLDYKTAMTIAVKWQREGIKTVTDAFDYAKSQYQKRVDYQESKDKKTNNRKVPDWVGKEIKDEYLSDEELEIFEKKLRGELVD